MAWETGEVVCSGCGQATALRDGSFCSPACRQRDRRARRRASRRLICAACKEAFVPSRKDARFCSDACRFHAYRARKAAKAEMIRKAIDLAARLIG